jgi:hypothetical protein
MPRALIMALVVSAFSVTASASNLDAIPQTFQHEFGGEPLWVSARYAVSGGRLRAGVLSPGRQEALERLRDRNVAEQAPDRMASDSAKSAQHRQCDVTLHNIAATGISGRRIEHLTELQNLAAQHEVISGVVVATEVGLSNGTPHTVVKIETDESQKRKVYLLVSRGTLHFNGMTVCNENRAFGDAPSVGDRVLFPAPQPLDAKAELYMPDGSWVVSEHNGELMAAPEVGISSELDTLSEVVSLLRLQGRGEE